LSSYGGEERAKTTTERGESIEEVTPVKANCPPAGGGGNRRGKGKNLNKIISN